MDNLEGKVYLITPTQPRSVKVAYTLKKIRGIQEQVVNIEEWFQWGQGYVGTEKNISMQDMWAECDMSLGCEFEDTVAVNFSFSGDNWNDKERHRIQKDYAKGAIDRIVENDDEWYVTSSKFYINAPFRINLINKPEKPTTHRTFVRASKKSLLTKKEQL
jgi:hypothetical protein